MGRDFENRKHAIFKTAGMKTKLYSKYGRQIYAAAKGGVPEIDANPSLRSIVEKAKKDQVPGHVIEKAIQKAQGVGGEDYFSVRYEGFGPGGSLVIVDCLTDNNQRTISEVRACFSKTGSKMAAPGSVALSFDRLAILSFKGENEDAVLEAMLDADVNVDEVESSGDKITIFAPADEFYKAKTALLKAYPNVELEAQEISFLPQTSIEMNAEDLPMFEKFINMLNECEDVQEIYHNVIMPS